jgi:glycosyltransferase involved in cell wall biosynthesis
MKIIVVAAMFPPAGHGGAEDCARSFAQWAAANGHDVAVVMAAADNAMSDGFDDGSVPVHRIATDHIYPIARARDEPAWKKPIWYAQDLFGNGTPSKVAKMVAAERPDVIMIHYVQGFGYRTIAELARLGAPIAIVLHDLGMVCMFMGMFRNDAPCGTPCVQCRLSTLVKRRIVDDAARSAPLGFISPSRANLRTIERYLPLDRFARTALLNTKTYPIVPRATPASGESGGLRLLYAGKLQTAKGIDRLAEAVALLPRSDVTLTIAGAGPLETMLRDRHADDERIRFLGFVSQETLAETMATSDLLCVPSIWPENSPGVVAQAILNGLPIAATGHGGLPELVRDGIDGRIIAGDDVNAWRLALDEIAVRPEQVAMWRARLSDVQPRFDIDVIGHETIAFFKALANGIASAIPAATGE